MADWRWWVFSDIGLAARLAIGGTILLILAGNDLRRHGRAATRWREYAFLLIAAAAAAAYGAMNDLVTSAISWEYFYFGKGLSDTLGPVEPPAVGALAWGAAKIGMASSWSAGVLAGAILLLANSYPGRRGTPVESMSMPRLLRWLWRVAMGALIGGVIGGIAGRIISGFWMPIDLHGLGGMDDRRAALFMTTWGIHGGSYLGAGIATIQCAWRIRSGGTSALTENKGDITTY